MIRNEIRHEVQQIQKEFKCDELEAINILLQLIIMQNDDVYFEEDLERILSKAA